MLNVQRLRVLKAVAESGSFSRAAETLSYTQSAVSQAIATLEHETGATLLDRDRRGVRPTAVGAALVAHADAILARIGDAESDLEAIVAGGGGRLRMASFPTAGATLMPLAIAAFRARRPRVELSLAEAEPEEIVPRLRAGELDLALLFEFPDAGPLVGGDGLRRADLLEDRMYLALPEHTRSRTAPTCASETSPERRGSRPRPRAHAPATSSTPAAARGSSRSCRSRATTTRRCRASSRRASAWR